MRALYTEPYLEGACKYDDKSGLYIFNGDYTYGVGGTCLEAKVNFNKRWWYKHDTGIGVMASRFRPLYPEPDIMPLPLPVRKEREQDLGIPADITLPTPLFIGVGIALFIGIAILMKFKI